VYGSICQGRASADLNGKIILISMYYCKKD
jgi:hypothetical protein